MADKLALLQDSEPTEVHKGLARFTGSAEEAAQCNSLALYYLPYKTFASMEGAFLKLKMCIHPIPYHTLELLLGV